MTDRHAGYIVALEEDIREDDAEETLNAIRNIKRVVGVEPIIRSIESDLAYLRVRSEIATKFFDFYQALIGRE